MKLKAAAASIGHFLCNEIVASIPSRRLRRLFYSAWLGNFGEGSGVQMHCRFNSGPRIFLGRNSVINHNTLLDGRRYRIVVGDNVSIGPHALVFTLAHDPLSPEFADKGGDVIIEDHVWIASNAVILPNVRIGRGAVVAAGAVVSRNVPEFTIVAGVPARPIGQRNRDLSYQLSYSPWLQ